MDAELLMVSADDGRPRLSGTLPLNTAPRALPERTEVEPPTHLYDQGGDPDALPLQRWGLVVPEGPRGDTLLGLVRRLREAREGEQHAQAQVYRVPARMSLAQARDWKYQVFAQSAREQDRPRYLLVLGDLHEVPLELQQALSSDGFVGRLAFSDDAGYSTYAEKVLRWESAPQRGDARALFFTSHDQSPATRVGHRFLVTPSIQHCRENQELGHFRARNITEVGEPTSWGRELSLAEAGAPIPSVLFSMSHGLGPPRRGWSSDEEQQRLQGAMSLGPERLEAADVAARDFLPGGFWFYFACFGAGTPAQSSYYPWLKHLREAKLHHDPLEALEAALARRKPFVAALPQAALANPNGPLAVVGHVDSAWTYAFMDTTGQSQPSRFTGVLREIAEGRRAGLAIHALWRFAVETHVDLATRVHEHEHAHATNRAPNPDREPWPALWMACQDLSGYVLLGDPAARLPVSRRAVPAFLPANARAGEHKPRAKAPRSARMEQAVLAMLAGDRTPENLAQAHGATKGELLEWLRIYMDAGRKALRKRSEGG